MKLLANQVKSGLDILGLRADRFGYVQEEGLGVGYKIRFAGRQSNNENSNMLSSTPHARQYGFGEYTRPAQSAAQHSGKASHTEGKWLEGGGE